MKLPFTWEELTPEDKAWLENVPACAVWDFLATLPPDERAPFDAPLYAPSGADFMLEYGDRLREYVATHPEGLIDRDWIEELNQLAGATDTEAAKAHAEKLDQLKRRFFADRNVEAYFEAVRVEDAAYWAEHRGELEPFQKALLEERAREEEEPRHDPLVITAKRKATANANKKTEDARTHQSAQDKRIEKLKAKHKAEIAKLTEERDAARLAYLELLDRQAERGEGGAK